MEHVRAIEDTVDEHKDTVPTEVARVVMKSAQALYDIHKKLHKLTWTVVNAHAQG